MRSEQVAAPAESPQATFCRDRREFIRGRANSPEDSLPTAIVALLLLALLPAPAAAQGRVLVGEVVAAGAAAPTAAWIVASTEAGADSVRPDSAGRFAISLPALPRGAPVKLRRAGDSLHFPLRATVHAEAADTLRVDLVLAPRRWTIAGGSYAGVAVPLRLDEAFRRWCERCASFLRDPEGADRAGRPARVPSWPDSLFPLRVAFEPDGNPPVLPADSLAFWGIVDEMEREAGLDLFRAVPLAETEPADDEASPEDLVLVVLDPTLESAGYGGTGQTAGDILHATVRFREGRIFRAPAAPHLVRHEMMHALGFGHTCSWRTVLQAPACEGLRSPRLTPDDVAHLQLLVAMSRLQRARPGSVGVEGAVR